MNSSDNNPFADAKFYRREKPEDLPKLAAQSRRRSIIRMSLVLVILLVAGLGYFWWQGSTDARFGEEAVSVTLRGPEIAPSGQEVEYVISYENNQRVDLMQAGVDLRLPLGFKIASTAPTLLSNNHIEIGSIGSFKTGEVVIGGQITGTLGEDKSIGALFSYRPISLKAEFSKTLSITTRVVASVLNLGVEAPTEQNIDQPLSLFVIYHNSSQNKLSNLLLKLDLPSGFEMEVPSLTPLDGLANVWQLPNLEADAEGKIEIKGKFTATAIDDTPQIKVALGFNGQEESQFTMQEEKVVAIKLVRSTLMLGLTINDVSTKSAVELGQELNYQLSYQNAGSVTFSDAVLKAKINPSWFDVGTFKDDSNGRFNSSTGEIIWTVNELPQLKVLEGGSRGVVSFRMRLQGTFPAGVTKPASFISQAEIQGKARVNDNKQTITVSAPDVVSKILTHITLETEARYYTDNLIKVGSGPLPPKVGQTTTYLVYFRLANILNEVNNIEVFTTLPAGILWTDQSTTTAGSRPVYDSVTREVRWRLNRLPAGAGTIFPKPEASFEVAVTPEVSDADKILVLTKATTLTAQDTFTETTIVKNSNFLTTELVDDLGAQGKGAVAR